MQAAVDYIDTVAKQLNLSRDEMIRESLRFYLEKRIRELKADIYKIRTKYGVSSIEDFEEKYKRGEIEEKDSWQEFQELDHLEFKRDELEKALAKIRFKRQTNFFFEEVFGEERLDKLDKMLHIYTSRRKNEFRKKDNRSG